MRAWNAAVIIGWRLEALGSMEKRPWLVEYFKKNRVQSV